MSAAKNADVAWRLASSYPLTSASRQDYLLQAIFHAIRESNPRDAQAAAPSDAAVAVRQAEERYENVLKEVDKQDEHIDKLEAALTEILATARDWAEDGTAPLSLTHTAMQDVAHARVQRLWNIEAAADRALDG